MATLIGTVDLSSRLMPHALRIPGWGHMMGNAIKHALKSYDRWPAMLEQIRSLVKMFRNTSWRQHIAKWVETQAPGSGKLFAHFSASLAKWRYETVYTVFCALLPLRHICEGLLRANVQAIFPQFQEKDFLVKFKAACIDGDLWSFLKTFSIVSAFLWSDLGVGG